MTLKSNLKNYLKKTIIPRFEETVSYGHNYLKQPDSDQIRVLIFAQGRTGSTLLESLLVSTGHFRRHGEILNTEYKDEVRFPLTYIRGLSNWHANDNFICHVKLYHLTEDRQRPVDPVTFLKTLSAEGWKFIYLKRENKVMHALSNLIAESRGIYHKTDDKKEKFTLGVDCPYFEYWVKRRFQLEAAEQAVLDQLDSYHEVFYERDLEQGDRQQETVNSILQYLALEPKEANARTRKINTIPLPELISNYDEFLRCVQQNNWQEYLPEAV